MLPITIIEPLLLHPFTKITASQIAKLKNINQKTTYNTLLYLEQQHILTSSFQGKNRLFYWNTQNPLLVKEYILAIEHYRTLLFYQTHPELKHIIQLILPHIQGICILFGSYANNTQNDTSDIDIYIVGTYKKNEILKIVRTYHIPISIKQQYTYEQNALTQEILKNHIIIKGAYEYIQKAIPWII